MANGRRKMTHLQFTHLVVMCIVWVLGSIWACFMFWHRFWIDTPSGDLHWTNIPVGISGLAIIVIAIVIMANVWDHFVELDKDEDDDE